MPTTHVSKLATTVAAAALLAGCSSGINPTPAEPDVPQACLDALDSADQVHDLSGEALILAADAVDATYRMDADRVEQLTADLDELPIQSRLAEYRSARDACVGGGRA